jgi:glucose/mannose-6-phosphate isomerase
MEQSILNFNKEFEFEPEIQNIENLGDFDHVILCGMGGSHLSADLIKSIKPGVDIYIHKDYGLPPYEKDFLERGLLIVCSYSGNTEETVSFMKDAYNNGLKIAGISTGGEILDFARGNDLPFVEIPNTGIQPRQADGYTILAILKLMGDEDMLSSLSLLAERLDPESLRTEADRLFKDLENRIPIVYSSNQNLHIAYNWKITLNETGKIPAFYNVFPELNHNEMQGFESRADQFSVIILRDDEDRTEIKRRMDVTKELYEEKGIKVVEFEMNGNSREERVFNAILVADWLSLAFASKNGVDPESVPVIEKFKEKL